MNKQIDDPQFGKLVHEVGDLWVTNTRFEFFGKDARVRVEVQIDQDDGLEVEQLTAYRQFIDAKDALINTAESVLEGEFNRYLSDQDGVEIELNGKVADHIHAESIFFPYAEPVPTFGLLCKCTWDPSNGIAVRYENGVFVRVGSQNLLL